MKCFALALGILMLSLNVHAEGIVCSTDADCYSVFHDSGYTCAQVDNESRCDWTKDCNPWAPQCQGNVAVYTNACGDVRQEACAQCKEITTNQTCEDNVRGKCTPGSYANVECHNILTAQNSAPAERTGTGLSDQTLALIGATAALFILASVWKFKSKA